MFHICFIMFPLLFRCHLEVGQLGTKCGLVLPSAARRSGWSLPRDAGVSWYFFIMACVISCFFNPFHQFPHCLWLDSKLSKMGIEVWTLDFTNSTIRGSIGKLMQHIAGHSHCALIRQTGNVCYCSSHSSI